MGWRVSWYKADKNEPITHISEDDESTWFKINGEQILNDGGTDIWQELSLKNEEFKKEINCLFENDDVDVFSITKKGFEMIILGYRQKVIDYMKAAIDLYEHPEEKYLNKHWFTLDLVKDYKSELREWESTYKDENGISKFFNIDLNKPNDKFGISGSWLYKYAIFDMIEIYKYFDWDKYTMVVYGG